MHSWIFRHRRRLEELYGLAPGRPPDVRPGAQAPGERGAVPAAGARAARQELRARVLVPARRRAAS